MIDANTDRIARATMYRVTGTVTVSARSNIHDSRAVWHKLTGQVNADPHALEAATATLSVDMAAFDAGDWLKNRRIRNDFDVERNPTATFQLTRVTDVKRDGNRFEATATGTLTWRGAEIPLTVAGKGVVDAQRLEAAASFSLDITRFGVKPPKILMFKVEDVVAVDVAIAGSAA
jgi:polyisoprenoid-binding protein YceI